MLIGQEVTVVGGGIGGLAAALALARHGAQVTVLEQAPEITEVGAGIQISPNGWRVLQALSVADAVAALSPRSQAVRLRDFRRGAEVFSLPLGRADHPWHLVHRADLVAALLEAAEAAGVVMRLGTRVAAIAPEPMGTAITLMDGTVESHGLTIAADGLHSPARVALNPRSRPFFTGQVAWRCTIPVDSAMSPEAHVFMGPGRHLVRYPLRDRRLVNVVAVEERDGWAAEGWQHRDDPAHLARAFVDFCPELRSLLDAAQEVFLWGLFRHPVAQVWQDHRLALLGDAAHPTLPFLAQGANMALEDAYVLARCLSEDPDTRTALVRYEALRRPRCARIVQAANDNAENYHLRPGPMRFAVHTALRAAQRFAPHVVAGKFDWVHRFDVTA
ncbi:FAD-dependent oxidoreductase [Roseicyclus mahoneyensis]|uniref:Salicylate hydroxylase n=1 Tax=Roseicyclus mahoneyensis TaxID=164332 RepID=A0A316GMC1_9RHOB|nr:FAD-dependent oxidoreductase [Roseicyclus mahoneyensis]PWK62064.1 salicylate hydroxylase [Roseicyclus mahoneyensis]